jgi:hypothetical protein
MIKIRILLKSLDAEHGHECLVYDDWPTDSFYRCCLTKNNSRCLAVERALAWVTNASKNKKLLTDLSYGKK